MDEVLDNEIIESGYSYTFRLTTVFIWHGILMLAFLFQVLSWPLTSPLWLLGSAGLSAYSLSGFLSLKGKNTLNIILCASGVFWFIVLIWGMFFNGGYPFNYKGVLFYSIVFALFLALYEVIKFYKKRKSQSNDI